MRPSPLLSGRRFLPCAAALLLVPWSASPAQTPAGVVYAWGQNAAGQLGNGTTADSTVPAAVGGLGGVTAIAAGNHTVAILNGAADAWGYGGSGELGNGTTTQINPAPVAVTGLGSGVTAVAATDLSSAAVQNGHVFAWGNNDYGQLGNGTTASSAAPVAVSGLSSVTAVAGGGNHFLAIQNGAAYAWGNNEDGELGNGQMDNSSVPVAVSSLGSGVTAVAGGGFSSLAIQNGAAYAWGLTLYGGENADSAMLSTTPLPVTNLTSGVTSIAAGAFYALAVQNGHVFAWGDNTNGQLGDGTTDYGNVPVQVDAADLHDIVAVSAGDNSSYALSSDGSLWVWGNNANGQLGLGNTVEYHTPQHLLPPSGYRYSAVVGGEDFAVAILAPPPFFDGQVALSNGVYYLAFPNGNYFGYYSFLSDPSYLYHDDLGFEYVFDAADGKAGVYFYDFASRTFFYTSPTFPFPYLYDFTLNTVLYYYPDPNNAGRYNTDGVRYFYDFNTQQIITK